MSKQTVQKSWKGNNTPANLLQKFNATASSKETRNNETSAWNISVTLQETDSQSPWKFAGLQKGKDSLSTHWFSGVNSLLVWGYSYQHVSHPRKRTNVPWKGEHFKRKGLSSNHYMGGSKNNGTPKWMVYNGKPYWNGCFGGTTIFGNTHIWT